MTADLLCSWCGKSSREVQIVAGPCVYICRDCHTLVADIFAAGLSTPEPTPEALPARQQAVLDHIRSKIASQGYAPTVREIAKALGARSTSGVQAHIKALERKGYIRHTCGVARSIVITDRGSQ